MVEVEIDGKKVEIEEGSMVIEAADKLGIYIPRFCYHNKLSVAANCRMCLVEVEKSGKPLPACATPVTPEMKVFTKTQKAKEAQKSIMEFLLINHPLDCPICDQGGECELQDLALGYGKDVSRYTEGKRSVDDEDLGPLVETEMTRCIHCTRCVRFGREVSGLPELGATYRGEHRKIGVYIEHCLQSEVSGNVIDLCPVGALTHKPSRYKARAWEMQQYASVTPHDCVGTNLYLQTFQNNVIRSVPRDNESINECWIADRDRFSYEGIHSPDRLLKPMIKHDDKWSEASWSEAFDEIYENLSRIKQRDGAHELGGMIAPTATAEEAYLFQKFLREFGTHHVDHRLKETDTGYQDSASLYPTLGTDLETLGQQDLIFLVGSNLQQEQPIINLRVRKATLHDAKVMVINPVDYEFNYTVNEKLIVPPQFMVKTLAEVVKALADKQGKMSSEIKDFLVSVQPSEQARAMADQLSSARRASILLGQLALHHTESTALRALAHWLGKLSGATVGYLTEGANSAGAWIAGAIPHRGPSLQKVDPGLACYAQFKQKLKAYFLVGFEPDRDTANPQLAMEALNNAEFVVAMSAYHSDSLESTADVLLPMGTFAETSGTYVNVNGQWQSFQAAIKALGESRPAWKVLRVMGNIFELPGFEYQSSTGVLEELKYMTKDDGKPNGVPKLFVTSPAEDNSLTRLGDWPIYSVDPLVRHADSLNETDIARGQNRIFVNEYMVKQLRLKVGKEAAAIQNGQKVILQVVLDNRLPNGVVRVPAGLAETAALGAAMGEIVINKL